MDNVDVLDNGNVKLTIEGLKTSEIQTKIEELKAFFSLDQADIIEVTDSFIILRTKEV